MKKTIVLALALLGGCGEHVPDKAATAPSVYEPSRHGIVEHFYENDREEDVTETWAFGRLLERRTSDPYEGRLFVEHFDTIGLLYSDEFEGEDMTRRWYDRDGNEVHSSSVYHD
jgi:hypothetical protein